jgi:hypothetical protein
MPDLDWLLLMTLRYSLGRMSYAPSMTSEIIIRHKAALTEHRRKQMVEEIKNHLDANPYTEGFQDIPETWKALAAELEK